MKKVLRAVFSMLLVASVAFSASADATLNASKQGSSIVDAKRQALTRTVTARPDNVKDLSEIARVRTRKALDANALRSAYTQASLGFKKPIAQAVANVPPIYGSMIYSTAWEVNEFGLYELPTVAGGSFDLLVEGPNASFGGVVLDGVYYSAYQESFWGFVLAQGVQGHNITTGELVYDKELPVDDYSFLSKGLAEYNGTVYGIFLNATADAMRLGTIEYAENGPVVTEIAPLADVSWNGFAIDGNGQGYGIKLVDGKETLCKINISDGAVTVVGETGISSPYVTGMAFETKSNRLFWTVSTDDMGGLAEINTTTGAATLICEFPNGEEVAGLYIPTPPEDAAPGAATDLKFDFEEGSLTGTVSFKAPTTYYNGEAATGSVNYEVFFGETSVKTGTAAYGEAVSFECTIAASGSYKVTVVPSNEHGPGLKTKGSVFVGMGIPVTPVATLVYENGEMKLSWEAVTETVDGGFIDEETVTYTVTRYPDGTVVDTFPKIVTSIAEAVKEPEVLTTYYYEVVANSGDVKSAAGKSNVIILGDYILPPFAETFDDASSMGLFSVIDANADGKAWTWYNEMARMQWNSEAAMDDWLMTAPVKLEAGKLYELEFDASANSSFYPERFEVKMGNAATAEAMTTVLVEPTVVDSDYENPQHFIAYVVPETAGDYHFGFHGISDANMYYLYLDNISISEAKNADIPASVNSLAVTPGANGGLFANLSFVTPDKLLSGKAITTPLTKVEVVGGVDNEVLYTATDVAAGAEIVYPVNVPVDGTYTFTVTAYNENGAGVPASASAYIGIDYPEAVANAKLTENAAKPGEVTITWDAVTKDVRGSSINATYSVYGLGDSGNRELVVEGLTETKYVCTPVAEGEQDYIQYAIFAYSKRGEGEGAMAQGFVGTPYDGYFESFPEGKVAPDHLAVITTEGMAQWGLFTDGGGISAADGDNGFVGLQGQYLDDAGEIMFGKISLANLTTPVLSFYTFNVAEDNINILDVYIDDLSDDADYQLVYEDYVCETGAANAWNKVVIDLSEYKGKEIALKLGASVQAYAIIAFDAIKVADKVMKDLSVKVDAPATVVPNSEFKVNVTVKNEADAASEAYVAKLKVNNVVFATLEGEALEMGTSKTFQVPYAFSAVDVDPVEFVAEVVYAGDEVADNNVTDGFTVSPKLNKLPVPVELEGEVTPEGVKLAWGEPNLEVATSETIVEDFETGEAGDMEFEGWTFVDVDGVPVGGFQGLDVPGITVGQTTASFFMFDASLSQFNETFAAHSGTKYLAAMFRYDDGQADDWAISPELSGNAQTVSFFARSYSADYPEKIEVYYSTGSTDPADFIKIDGAGGTVPADWTLYSANLPEGAAYFAVRSCATGSFMLMLDDVTYEAGAGNIALVGYNVYRNGAKVNAEPEAECEYLDTEAVAENNEYVVTAVYNRGESVGSNKVVVAASGIDNVLAGVEIAAEAGQITVTGAEGLQVSVVAVDGKVVFAAAGEAKTVVTVTPGVYVVKAGAKVAKVLVK